MVLFSYCTIKRRTMRQEKVTITLESFDRRLLVNSLVEFKNRLEQQGQPTEDVASLILKVINAPCTREKRRFHEAR